MVNRSANDCGICGAQCHNAYLCNECEVKLSELVIRAGLTQSNPFHPPVLCILDELDLQMSRQSRAAPRYGGRSAETPIPFDSRAAKAHATLSDLLTTWARRYHAPTTALAGPRRSADWLRFHVPMIALTPHAESMFVDLEQASAYAIGIIDNPESKDYIGICSSLIDGKFCNVDLYAVQGMESLTCPHCGTVHDVGGRRETMFNAADDLLLNGIDIARIAGVMGVRITAAGVYRWRFRGRLIPRGTNAEGHPLYRLGDVLELARASPLRIAPMKG